MPSLPPDSTPNRRDRSARKRSPFPGPIICLLLGVIVLANLAPAVRADEALTEGRDAQRFPQKEALPSRGGGSLALNARGIDALPVDPLKTLRCAVELIDLPEAFTPGQINRVRVRVSFADGHKLLTGLPDGPDLRIDLKLLDATGRELYRRAAIKVSRLVAELRVMVPTDTVGPVTVQVELNDRPGPQMAGANLGASRPQGETTHLASVTGQVPLSQLRLTVAQRLLLLLALRRPH